MAQVIIRIELKGSPSGTVYQDLHALMERKGWKRTIVGAKGETPLPSAMYQGQYNDPVGDLSTALHDHVVPSVWSGGSAVLVMALTDWAQHGWWFPEY